MENYSYQSYPGSGGSSPRSREIDFENNTPWEEHSSASNYKVQFMCSYGGKIHPRPNDNQLSYIGGQNRILFVDRTVKFPSFLSVLSSLCTFESSELSFKYQLPGEDLDALISVTNDDDFEHMMTEFDRLYRSRSPPQAARLRIFLFRVNPPLQQQQDDTKLDHNRLFVDALNSGPTISTNPVLVPAARGAIHSNVDFLLDLDKGNPSTNVMNNPLLPLKLGDPIPVVSSETTGKNPNIIPVDIQRHIQDLQRLQLQDQQYRRKVEENSIHPPGGEYYVQKPAEKQANNPNPLPQQQVNIPSAVPYPYWPPEKQIGAGFPASGGSNTEQQQAVYMIPAPAAMYHAPSTNQQYPTSHQGGYYQVQRMNPDMVYGDQHQQQKQQQPYNLYAPSSGQVHRPMATSSAAKAAAYSGGEIGYTQVAYDSAGRQVFYTPAAYPAGVNAEMMMGSAAAPVQEGKVTGTKVSSQTL